MSICPGISLMAQGICSSSALAPVYSETFGVSSSSSKKNVIPTGFVTNYEFYSGNGGLSDGQYIVTPLGKNAGRNDWAQGADHTGNTNGNMYIVNAGRPSSGPVDLFFSKQVDNLCPGSVYSFSAWLANMNTISSTKSICGSGLVWPKVTFNIKNTSGTILKTFTTDTLPLTQKTNMAPNWQQYGFQFTLPAGTTSLILEMRDGWGGQASYCGNDLAIDDIVFSACTPTATATLSTSSNICAGTTTSINSSLVNSPFSNPAYQWQQSTDGGTTWVNIGTAGTGSANYTIASAATTHSGMYRVIVGPDVSSLSSTTCVTASNAISLSVNPAITITATSNSPVCSGTTLSFTSSASGGTGPFTYSWTGPNGFSSTLTNPSITNVGTAAAGTYTFTATDSKNCAVSATIPVTVGTTPPSVGAITGADGGCTGTNIVLGNSTSGGTWSSSNTAIATVAADGTVSLLSSGSAVITYTVNNGSCSVSASKTITVASVTLHPDVIECNNGIAHFDATDSYYGVTYSNNNAGNSFAWTVSGGPFSFQGSSTASSQYPGMQFQTGYSYQVILRFTTNGVTCIDTQMVYKNVTAADTIQGSRDTTVCFNSAPINLSGKVSPVTNTFKWTTTGTGTFSNPNALNTTYTPSLADKTTGTIKIYLSGSSTLNATGNCGSSTSIDSMTLRIYPDNVGTNTTQVICSNQALNFTPSSAIAGSTYSWISAISAGTITGNSPSGTGNIIDSLVNLSNTNDAVVVYTITPFAFTPSNVSCSGTPFTLTVTARPKPAITITNTTTSVCTGSATNLQFSSSLASSTFTWNSSVVSGTVTGNSSNATASATNTIMDLLTAAAGTNAIVRYRITAISPQGCSQTDSTDILIYGASTIANAGTDQNLCNVNNVLLAANNPVLGNGSWTQLSGPSTAVFGNASSASTTLSGLIPGTYRLVWSITNGTCPASTDTVDITNAPPSVAGTLSADATVCSGNNSGTLSLSGYTGNILRWESSTDNGNTWITIANTSNTYTYNNITVTTIFRTVVQSGVCASVNSAPVTILVNPVSVPGTVSADATVCSASNSGTLSLAGYTGSILRWESSIDNGVSWNNISNTTANHDYTNLTSTTLFRAVVQSGSCGALSSNAVTITVTAPTIAGSVTANATVCTGSNNGTLNLGGHTGNILNWESSTDNGATWVSIANTTSQLTYNNLTTTTQYRATVQSGACPAFASAAATITTLLAVSTANAGTDQVLCSTSSTTLAANAPSSGSGTWSFVSGPSAVSFSNANDPASVVNGLTTGAYQLAWTISNGVCAPSQDIVQITVNPQTVPGTLSASATVCASANSGTLS
ncbi:MAG: hypothetical protein IM598_14770, partial [Chitinophagaceae bacterium]|nr:hypothetical protein [Chitinophagaceae bacterium]